MRNATVPARVSQSRSRYPLRWLRRSALRSPGAALQMPSVSNCISRSAAKPIISRRNVASEPFSKSARRAILSSVIGVVLGFRLFLDNSTLPRIIAMATDWPAYARLSAVAAAGQSVASYTTNGDTTVLRIRGVGVGFLVDRTQPHPAHQPDNPVSTNSMAQPVQVPHHLPRAVMRAVQERLVDEPHQCQRRRTLADRLIVAAGTADLEQRALPHDREVGMRSGHHLPPPFHTHRPETFAKKSRSTTSWPILACSRVNSASPVAG